jgi:hypothetical protein
VSFAAVFERLQRQENPYPGLRPFETTESHLFFGRSEQVAELLARVERNRLLAVVGVSGSGKSSLVRAGLIPALQRNGHLEPGTCWRTLITRPAGAPFETLTEALSRNGLDGAGLRNSSHGLIEIAARLPASQRLLVVVDQFEELFRYKELSTPTPETKRRREVSAADAAEFVHLLLAASRHEPPIYVVLTMRSDYLGDCAQFRDLPERLNDCQYIVPRLTRGQRKEAIERPLGRTRMTPALVQRMLNDVGDEPDQLPILQHALMRTWARWREAAPEGNRSISLEDYQAIGSFEGALNQHAETLLRSVPREIAEAIFRRLTARGPSNRERREPARLAELWAVCGASTDEQRAGVNAVVDLFRQGEASFLQPRTGGLAAEDYVDISHESLIRQWRTLSDVWLPSEQRAAKTLRELVEKSRNWRMSRAELLRGLDLTDALNWERERNRTSAWAEYYVDSQDLPGVVDFLKASAKERAKDEQRLHQRFAIAGFLSALFAVLATVAVFFWQESRESQRIAESRRYAALAREAVWLEPRLARRYIATADTFGVTEESQQARKALLKEANVVAVWRWRRQGELAPITAAGFSADGQRVALSTAWSTAFVWSWRACENVTFPNYSMLRLPGAATNDQRDRIVSEVGNDDARVYTAVLRSFRRAEEAQSFTASSVGPILTAAFSSSGRYLALGGMDFKVRIWDLEGKEKTRLLRGHRDVVTSVRFSGIDPSAPENSDDLLVSAGQDGWGLVWDWKRDSTGRPLRAQTLALFDASFQPRRKDIVAAAGQDGYIYVWRLAGEKPVFERFAAHKFAVQQASFSPDGARLVTASLDGTAVIWNWNGERLERAMTLEGHRGGVTGAEFSPDGRYVVTSSLDGTARIWMASPPPDDLSQSLPLETCEGSGPVPSP